MDYNTTCAFTGHRPSKFSFGYDEEHPDCIRLKELMQQEIVFLMEHGVTTFISGMALGVDIWGAELVLAQKEKHPQIQLIAAIPCETQANKWSVEQRERYFDLLAQCDDTVYISNHYSPACMFLRNRWMVDHAKYLLAVYNGEKKGGAAYTVDYARKRHCHVIQINPEKQTIIPNLVVLQGNEEMEKAPKLSGHNGKTSEI
ncbi:MAG: SLOG family protein [Lachnospiraceae bacterium]|nr:SLOG family protein [Lachnospiraceae bacterium]